MSSNSGGTQLQRCTACIYTGLPSTFPLKKRGSGRVKTCAKCTQRGDHHRACYAKESTENKENGGSTHIQQDQVHKNCKDIDIRVFPERMPTIAYEDVLEIVSWHKDRAFKLDCMATLTEAEAEDMGFGEDSSVLFRAHAVAQDIWDACGWRFKCINV